MKLITALSLTMAISLVSCGSKDKKKHEHPQRPTAQIRTMSPQQLAQETESWSFMHKELIKELSAKYGQPNGSTGDSLIWNNNGPWIKTVLKKNDMKPPLEQTAAMDVPPEKVGDVALFDKGVVVNASAHEVTSSAGREELNFLALNLTEEIVGGSMSPMEARRQLAQLTDVKDKSESLHGAKKNDPAMQAEEAEE